MPSIFHPLSVALHDDRGTRIEEADSAIVTGQGCTGEHEVAGRSGIQQVCHLFAVPTGTPVRDVEISTYGTDETV